MITTKGKSKGLGITVSSEIVSGSIDKSTFVKYQKNMEQVTAVHMTAKIMFTSVMMHQHALILL
jgi:hypothetical protein